MMDIRSSSILRSWWTTVFFNMYGIQLRELDGGRLAALILLVLLLLLLLPLAVLE